MLGGIRKQAHIFLAWTCVEVPDAFGVAANNARQRRDVIVLQQVSCNRWAEDEGFYETARTIYSRGQPYSHGQQNDRCRQVRARRTNGVGENISGDGGQRIDEVLQTRNYTTSNPHSNLEQEDHCVKILQLRNFLQIMLLNLLCTKK